MLSPEFKSAIESNNLLLIRIMLKDAFLLDFTFKQLDEMLKYAKSNVPDVIVPFDEDILENDISKWNRNVMDKELAQLINNFSEERISHLKKVVSEVMKKGNKKNSEQYTKQNTPQHSNIHTSPMKPTSSTDKQEVLSQLKPEIDNLNSLFYGIEQNIDWRSNINKIEQTVNEILKIIKSYKNNR